jgi:hypothetical protein
MATTTTKGNNPDWWHTTDEETFFRHLTVPEEDRRFFTSVPWDGGFRWFKSSNVVCLERYRRPPKERQNTLDED